MKKCNICNILKEKENFYKNPSSKDGLQTLCKKCLYEKGKIKTINNRKKNIDLILLEVDEVFKPINFNKNYLISNYGRVYVKEHFSTRYISSKFLKLTKMTNGYLCISINKIKYLVHRLVAQNFLLENDFKKTIVNHKDSERSNNKVENLEWVTNSENIKHGADKGNYSKKLKKEDVLSILKDTENTTAFLSEKFSVSKTNILLIRKRKIWKHITL